MGLNDTPSANRVHIGFFGRRNAGKSSLVNAVTGQQLAIVSDTKGTTTDPVYKAMELLPLGPVMIIVSYPFPMETLTGTTFFLSIRGCLARIRFIERFPSMISGGFARSLDESSAQAK